MKHINRLLPLLILLTAYSCIGDDMSDCPPKPLSLQFSYTRNMANADYFDREVDSLSVFLYKETDDSFVNHYRVGQDQLENGHTLNITGLEDGGYTLVAWAIDANTDYQVTDYTLSKQNMHAHLESFKSSVPATTGDLFHGMRILSVQEGAGYEQIDLTKNTSRLTIKLADRGASTSRPVETGDYQITLTAKNGVYNYDNTLRAGQSVLDYIQAYSVHSFDTLQAQSKMLRLFVGGDSRLQFKDKSGNIIPILDTQNNPVSNPVSLTDQILRNPLINTQEDLDRRDNFTLIYAIDRNPSTGELTISLIGIDDWTVNSGNPGI